MVNTYGWLDRMKDCRFRRWNKYFKGKCWNVSMGNFCFIHERLDDALDKIWTTLLRWNRLTVIKFHVKNPILRYKVSSHLCSFTQQMRENTKSRTILHSLINANGRVNNIYKNKSMIADIEQVRHVYDYWKIIITNDFTWCREEKKVYRLVGNSFNLSCLDLLRPCNAIMCSIAFLLIFYHSFFEKKIWYKVKSKLI